MNFRWQIAVSCALCTKIAFETGKQIGDDGCVFPASSILPGIKSCVNLLNATNINKSLQCVDKPECKLLTGRCLSIPIGSMPCKYANNKKSEERLLTN